MHRSHRLALLVPLPLLLLPFSSLRAQTAANPAGHWEGAIQAPDREVPIEVDLATNSTGALAGTFSNPAQHVNGLPLLKVVIEDRSISFHARADQSFKGVLSADDTSMSGDFTIVTPEGTFNVPFRLSRRGDARIEPPPKSAAIGKELEGTWNGTLDVEGKQLRAVLKMSNQPDGTSSASLVSVDEGGLEIPVAIIQKAASLTLDNKVTGSSYSGTLNTEGTELVGTYTQGQLILPLTFRRAGQ